MPEFEPSRRTWRGLDRPLQSDNTLTDGAHDRAHALRFASSLGAMPAQEIASLASSNPDLIGEWLDELRIHCEGAKAEARQLSRVIEHVLSASRPNIPIAAE